MTIVNGYTSRLTLKQRLGLADVADDPTIDSIVTAVSRMIDAECGTQFFVSPAQARTYTPNAAGELWIDDAAAIYSVGSDLDGDGVYEAAWLASDFQAWPPNARLVSPARPYMCLKRSPIGAQSFGTQPNGVQVVADWGFDVATPAVVAEACLLQCARLFRRKDAPFGVTGSAEMGQASVIPRLDPDVSRMLDFYKHRWGG